MTGEAVLLSVILFLWQECETKIAQEIASLSKEDVSKEEMNENEEVINILLAQVHGSHLPVCLLVFSCSVSFRNIKHSFVPSNAMGSCRLKGVSLSIKIQDFVLMVNKVGKEC